MDVFTVLICVVVPSTVKSPVTVREFATVKSVRDATVPKVFHAIDSISSPTVAPCVRVTVLELVCM